MARDKSTENSKNEIASVLDLRNLDNQKNGPYHIQLTSLSSSGRRNRARERELGISGVSNEELLKRSRTTEKEYLEGIGRGEADKRLDAYAQKRMFGIPAEDSNKPKIEGQIQPLPYPTQRPESQEFQELPPPRNEVEAENYAIAEAENQEAEYSNQLAQEQEIYQVLQQAEQILEQGRQYSHPSYFKYFIFYSMAVVGDGLSIILTLLGVTMIISIFTGLLLGATLSLMTWFTNTHYINAKKHVRGLAETASAINSQLGRLGITQGTKLAITAKGTIQTVKTVQYMAPRFIYMEDLASGFIHMFTFYTPAEATITSTLFEAAPIWNFFPWFLISVYLSYRSEKKAFRAAREASEFVYQRLTGTAEEIA